jgi:glycosyltransferase involved in cell wall biosynthesis
MPCIGLIWNAPVRLVDITTRYEPYVEGLRGCGVDALTICPAGTEVGYPYPVRTFRTEQELTEPAYWRALDCQAVVIITWHRMTPILHSLAGAGLRVLAIAESDGQLSPRFHSGATYQFMVLQQPTLRGQLGAAKHWFQRYWLHARQEHQALIENTEASPLLAFAAEGAARVFCDLLQQLHAPHLAERVRWLPYPVAAEFCRGPVAENRPDRVIAIGRWDAAQKHPQLLEATIRELLRSGSATEIWIVGKASHERFQALARTSRLVRLWGIQPRAELCQLMSQCRSVLITSRWESGPIVANEMLALGGTIVATPLPSLHMVCSDHRWGRLSLAATGRSLADAVRSEMQAWEAGKRSPLAIAGHWRPLVSPAGVAAGILRMLGMTAAA